MHKADCPMSQNYYFVPFLEYYRPVFFNPFFVSYFKYFQRNFQCKLINKKSPINPKKGKMRLLSYLDLFEKF